MHQSPVVSTQWLGEALEKGENIVILDASKYLPNEGKDARALFEAAHIAGAQFFDLDLFSDPETDLPTMVPSTGRFARLAGELGIGNDARVVIYDQKGLFSAARAWWLFGLFGHDAVFVLDGGLPKWQAEGRATESGPTPAPAPARYHPTFRAQRLRGLGDVAENLQSGAELVLDARSPARFSGAEKEPRPGARSGHIPQSRNLHYARLLNQDQTLRDEGQLRQIFAEAGDDGTRSVVTSCGSGVTAAILTLARARAGLPLGALYDGSWSEWGMAEDQPFETTA